MREGKLSNRAQGLIHTTAVKNYRLCEELMRELSGKEDTSELIAAAEMRQDLPEHVRLSENPFLVVCQLCSFSYDVRSNTAEARERMTYGTLPLAMEYASHNMLV